MSAAPKLADEEVRAILRAAIACQKVAKATRTTGGSAAVTPGELESLAQEVLDARTARSLDERWRAEILQLLRDVLQQWKLVGPHLRRRILNALRSSAS